MASHTTGPITQQTAIEPPTTPRDEPLTFLFTDVEGSTRLWETNPETMRPALERHDAIIRSAIADSGGEIVKTTGDGLMAVFAVPAGAVAAASPLNTGCSRRRGRTGARSGCGWGSTPARSSRAAGTSLGQR